MERTRRALTNSLTGFGAQLVITVLSFVNRAVFISALGGEYLGVAGLFSNILTMLALSELGVGAAVTYHMYRAVASGDQARVNALATFYAKVMRVVAACVAVLGVILSFFLRYLIKETTLDMDFLRVVFLIYVAESCVGYLLYYRASVLFVYQRDYVNKLTISFCSILTTAAQIAVLKLAPLRFDARDSYLIYLAAYMLGSAIKNVACYVASKRLIPEVKIGREYALDAPTRADILSRVKAMMVHKVSSIVTNATDNLIISKFISLYAVGVYSNYSTVIHMATLMLDQLVTGLQASIGDLIAREGKEKILKVFNRLNFGCFWLFSMAATGLAVMLNPFVTLWIGDMAYVMDMPTVIVLCANFYIIGLRQAVIITRNAGGAFVYDWIAPAIKAAANLVISIVLTLRMGLIGVFIGTLASSLMTDVAITPAIMLKKLLGVGSRGYYGRYLLYAALTALDVAVCYLLTRNVPFLASGGALPFLAGCAICLAVSNFTVFVVFFRTEEYRYYIGLAARLIGKVVGRARKHA